MGRADTAWATGRVINQVLACEARAVVGALIFILRRLLGATICSGCNQASNCHVAIAASSGLVVQAIKRLE